MSDPVETLWVSYPHSLYRFRDATGHIGAMPGHADSATIRAISLEEIRLYIVDSIIPSTRPRHAMGYPYPVQHTLNALMRTCSSFFGIAAGALWRILGDIDVLWAVLIKNDGPSTSGVVRPLEMQRYILRTYNNLEGHLQDINFAHLAYYASFIQELTASTTVIPGRLILLLSHMLPDGRHLFPRLKRLCWYDGHSPVGGLRAQFFDLVRGPRTSSIELLIPTTISSFNCWANEALGMLSNSPHPLSDIHIVASSPLSQSEQLAQRFQRHLVALFAITPVMLLYHDDTRDVDMQEKRSAAYLRALQSLWSSVMGGTACISVLDAPHTALHAHHFPSNVEALSPTRYILQHMLSTTTTIDIFCAINPVWTRAGPEHSGVSILQALAPLLRMGQLRAVHVEFRGQSFSFSEADLSRFLQSWRVLRELTLVYDLTTSNGIPDIADIHRLLGQYPDVRLLHIPGLAARDVSLTLSSMSTPDARPNMNLAYLSSSKLVADIPFSPRAIAAALLAMFPGIHGARPIGDDENLWSKITNDIDMLLELTLHENPSVPDMLLYVRQETST